MNKNLTVEIVMATYNGSKYIDEQLYSLKNQTYKNFDLLIIDDNSVDDTVFKIESFIKKYEISNWKVIKNDINIGWRKNFKKLLKMSKGDIVFFCDQDDIWNNSKIEKMYKMYCHNESINVLISNYVEKIEIGGKSEPPRKIKTKSKGEVEKVIFTSRNWFNSRPGCCMSFKKNMIHLILELMSRTNDKIPHDAATYLVGEITDSIYLISENLIEWRKYSESSFKSESLDKHSVYNQEKKYVENQLVYSTKVFQFIKDFEKEIKMFDNEYKAYSIMSKIKDNRTKIYRYFKDRNIWGIIFLINKFDNRSEYKKYFFSVLFREKN